MKFAIFGDIHANLEAFETVLTDAADNQCTHFACIGDIVGYNANPGECLEIVRNLECPVVKGNHDEEVSSNQPLTGLNPLARRALEWTRSQISEEDKEWIKNLRLVRQVREFTIVHATLDTPGGWNYVTNKFDALASFSYQFTPVCFYGHTHAPKFYVKSSQVQAISDDQVLVEPTKKYFVNVGSVGQPRDGDWRSSYAIYDIERKTINIRRLEYDIELAQQKIKEAGLPEGLATRLAFGK